jgi:hypothetical protein
MERARTSWGRLWKVLMRMFMIGCAPDLSKVLGAFKKRVALWGLAGWSGIIPKLLPQDENRRKTLSGLGYARLISMLQMQKKRRSGRFY